jgi:hypothetical protein
MTYDEVKAFALAIKGSVIFELNDEVTQDIVVDKFEQFAELFDLNNDETMVICVCDESNNPEEVLDASALVFTIAVFDVEEVYSVPCPSIAAEYVVIIDEDGVEIVTEDGSEAL